MRQFEGALATNCAVDEKPLLHSAFAALDMAKGYDDLKESTRYSFTRYTL